MIASLSDNLSLHSVRIADTCNEWLGKLIALGPTDCHHLMKTLTACSGSKLAIQLSPKSESLKSQVALGSDKETISQETLSAYETCMRGKLQEVTAACKRLDRMVSQEFEERKQEETRKKRQRELEEQADHAESVKKAARESNSKDHAHPEEPPDDDANNIPQEVGGFLTHSCRVVSELLDMLNISADVAQTGSAVYR